MRVFTHKERPDLEEKLNDFGDDLWIELIFHTEYGYHYYHHVWSTFADFNFYLGDDEENIVAAGIAIPLVWDGQVEHLPQGWDDALKQGVLNHERGIQPNTLCALATMVRKSKHGQGLSKYVIRAMKTLALKHGLFQFIAPVRPTQKHQYPLTPMERYMSWKREDESPFDPWLRAHWKEGGIIAKSAPKSMVTKGSVSQFEQWAKMQFPESGTYVVPGALHTVTINREEDTALYEEPNVWVVCNDIR